MANALYAKAKQVSLTTGLGLAAGNVKACLVLTGAGHYVVDLVNDQFLSVIAGGDIVATSGNFTTKTTTGGVFDADDITFTAVAAGPAAGALVIYVDTGVAATSPLIQFRDADVNLPVTPGGGNITVVWQSTSPYIFAI